MLRRMLFYWVGMVVRLGVWGVVGVGVVWVWRRGLEGAVEDLVGVVGAFEEGQGRGRDGRRGAGWEREREREMGRGRWR